MQLSQHNHVAIVRCFHLPTNHYRPCWRWGRGFGGSPEFSPTLAGRGGWFEPSPSNRRSRRGRWLRPQAGGGDEIPCCFFCGPELGNVDRDASWVSGGNPSERTKSRPGFLYYLCPWRPLAERGSLRRWGASPITRTARKYKWLGQDGAGPTLCWATAIWEDGSTARDWNHPPLNMAQSEKGCLLSGGGNGREGRKKRIEGRWRWTKG